MTKIIDGKNFAENLRNKIVEEIKSITANTGKKPGLAVIIVGDDPASHVYVRNKAKQTVEVGMHSVEIKLPADTKQETLLAEIAKLNADKNIHGILVQLPLPKHLSEDEVINAIAYEKDVDGFHIKNRGLLVTGSSKALVPCTPLGCMMMLEDRLGSVEGKNAVVIGRSNIVGKPMAQLLINAGATVTVCHSRTKNIQEITRRAEILVAAVGRPEMVTADYVSEGVTIIDVGINRIEKDGVAKLVGDVDFASVEPKAQFITPVPGGVGPMTIACLLNNTLKAFKEIEKI